MNVEIREIELEDYKEFLDFMKTVQGESNFLLSYADENSTTYEEEKEFIKNIKKSQTSNLFISTQNGKIIGAISFNGNERRKRKHYGTIGISVLKEHWGKGIASLLLKTLITWAKKEKIKKINLEVFENNDRAIHLYEKFDFKLEGKIEDGIFDGENYISFLIYGLKI